MERRRNPINEGYDEDLVFERDRRRNDLRLKGAFESIFVRYSRDFTDVGDEIDLETGEIVINNGHLSYMRDEQDLGEDDAGRMLRSFVTGQEVDDTSTADEDEVASDRRNLHSNDVLMEDSGSEDADSNYVSEQDEDEQEESEGDAADPSLMNSVWNDVPDIHGLRPTRRATLGNQMPFNTAALQAFSQTIATQIAQFMIQAFQPGLANSQGRSGSSLPARRRSTRPAPRSPPRAALRPARLSMPATNRRRRRSPEGRQSIWALPPGYTSPPRKRRSNGQGARRTVRSADGTTPPGGLEVPPTSNSTHVAVQDNVVSENWNQAQELSDPDYEQTETETDRSEVIHLDDRSDEQGDADEAGCDESVNQEPAGIQVTSKHPYSANTKRVRSEATQRTPFEREDDDLIVELHFEQKMPWKEMAEYFPGRSQWALENRYNKYIKPNLAEETGNESKDDIDQIVDLKENQRLSWEEIAERLPHSTPSAARGRYYREKASAEDEKRCLGLRENLSDEDILLLELRETNYLSWEAIGPHFPNRELNWLKNHYYKYLRLPGTQTIHPNRKPISEEDDARLLELKHDQGLDWQAIASHFPDRSLMAVQQRYSKILKKQLLKKTPGTGGTSNEELHSQGTGELVTRSSKRNGDAHRDRPQSSPLGIREKDGMSSRSAVRSDPQHEPHASPSSRPNVVSIRPPSPGEDENDGETLAELLATFGHRQPQPAPVSKTITSMPTSHQQTPQSLLVWKPLITPQSIPVTWNSCVTPRSVVAQSEVRTRSQREKSVQNAAGKQTPVSPKIADTATTRRKRRRVTEDSASEDELAQ